MSIGSTNFGTQIGIGASSTEASSSAPSAPPTTQSPDNEPEDPIYVDDLLQLLRAEPSTNQALGVYTHSSGQHYIIWLQGGKIYSIEPVMTDPGVQLRESYIADNPTPSSRTPTVGGSDDQCKYEAYVLGQIASLNPRVEIGEYRVEGSAFHYGWMFNWGGSEATLVTQKPNQELDGTLLSWTARTYTLSVSEDINGALSASVSSGNAVEWEPMIGRPHIWIPIFSKGGMRLWYPYGCGAALATGYGDADWKAPMFAFYKADGSLKTIYHESEVLPTKTIEELAAEARDLLCTCPLPNGGSWRFGSGTHEDTYTGQLGGYYHGFTTSDGEDWRGYESLGGLYHWKKIEIGEPTYTREEDGPTKGLINPYILLNQWTLEDQDLTEGDAFNNFWYQFQGGHVRFQQEYSTTSSGSNYIEHSINALLFPFHGAESAYIATYKSKYKSTTVNSNGWITITRAKQWTKDLSDPYAGEPIDTEYQQVLFPIPQYDCSQSSEEDRCLVNGITTYSGADYPENEPITEEQYTNTVIETEYSIDLHLVTPYGSLNLDSIEEVDPVDNSYMGSFYQVFFPAACDEPPTLPKYNNLQASFGNAIYTESGFDMSLGTNNQVQPPTVLQDSLWIGRS